MDGNEYLDLHAKSGAMIFGHSNRKYINGLHKGLDGVVAVDSTNLDLQACRLLINCIPAVDQVRFCLSGNEAVQNAIRLARAYTGKNKILRFYGHFHGTADNVRGGKSNGVSDPVAHESVDGPLQTKGRGRDILKSQNLLIPWNDVDVLEEIVKNYHQDIAAIISEPICVNSGSVMPKEHFFKKVRELADRYHIVFILDEAITGVRLGLGGAQGAYDIKPDISIFSKCIAGGYYPLSAIGGKRSIMEGYDDGSVVHGGTFNGYQLGLQAMLTTFQIIQQQPDQYEEMIENISRIHRLFLSCAQSIGLELVIQGPPACASFHCANQEIQRIEDLDRKTMIKNDIVRDYLLRNGIYLISFSRMYPNFSLDEEDVAFFESKIERALKQAKRTIDKVLSAGRYI